MDHDPDRNLLTISARNHFGPDRVPGPNLIKFCRADVKHTITRNEDNQTDRGEGRKENNDALMGGETE